MAIRLKFVFPYIHNYNALYEFIYGSYAKDEEFIKPKNDEIKPLVYKCSKRQ